MSLDLLVHEVRPPRAEPAGALVLFHGRGTGEHDLLPLLDVLDPKRRLLGVTPRGPLSLPPGGAHWYVVRRVGYPDPDTFGTTFERASSWLDALGQETGVSPERTFIGGFSQGAVMSCAMALARGRPRYAGLLAFSGFVPTVDGLEFDLTKMAGFPVAIGHGTYDPVISVDFSRAARSLLEDAGANVVYREYPLPHTIDPDFLNELAGWLDQRAVASSDSSSS
ncbi:MAG: alpha/beta hydrolase [Actinomycetota bacterium]